LVVHIFSLIFAENKSFENDITNSIKYLADFNPAKNRLPNL